MNVLTSKSLLFTAQIEVLYLSPHEALMHHNLHLLENYTPFLACCTIFSLFILTGQDGKFTFEYSLLLV